MPPYIPRKRPSSPAEAPRPIKPTTKKQIAPVTKKSNTKSNKKNTKTLFDDIDASSTRASADETRALLAKLGGDDNDDDDSDLSDVDSDEFEDVPELPPTKRRKVANDGQSDKNNTTNDTNNDDDEDEDDEDEIDFEDVDMSHQMSALDNDDEIQDINVSLNDDGSMAAEAGTAANRNLKKGPSKRDRQIRIRSHMMHVQALIFHNAVRNSWLNDKEVQNTLVGGLPDGVKKEVDRWKVDMGYKRPEEPKKAKKGKKKDNKKRNRDGRDWNIDADRLEAGVANLSRGDPIMRLLKVLAAYWKKRFTITAPGIRKIGYMPLRRLADDLNHWDKNRDDAEEHGERIESLQGFRNLAKKCEGSRDVGAQLFTALIRALGIEARMIASLQPVGFGWSKAEDAILKRPKSSTDSKPTPAGSEPDSSKLDDKSPITISDSDSDSDSVQELTSILTPASKKRPIKKYDRDLPFPHYWTEVLSPVSHTYIPVDSVVLSTVASTADLLATFEPRGKVSDQAKQVICYTIAYNPDNFAKDVTVRYLKKHQLPGRTKGFRITPERVPIHNKRGKVLRYEEQDWFATVLLPFLRPQMKRTEADDKEDVTDLKPFKPAGSADGKQKIGEESLQWYKQSAEFVLERHLRREEALLPHAAPVRTFTSGKGDKAKTEDVYSRSDVVSCKTVESWHKEGREIKVGEQPLKMVPVRAVTLIRKREMEEVQRETGEKLKQGLYSKDQTDWIIPPPIGPDRQIPKNAFGNMDCYVPSMVPRGAVHVKLKGCAKLCRKMDIEHAEACVGFEFGKQRAVPILFGVVVAEENEAIVRDAWRAEQELQRRKEDVKRQALVLHLWRKFVMGLRIVERMKAEYKDNGDGGEEVNPFVNRDRQLRSTNRVEADGEDEDEDDVMKNADTYDDGGGGGGGGGFFLPGEEEALLSGPKPTVHARMEEDDPYAGGGGFIIDDEVEEDTNPEPQNTEANGTIVKPMSLQSASRSLIGLGSASGGSEEDGESEEAADLVAPQSSSRRGRPSVPTLAPPAKPKLQARRAVSAAAKKTYGKKRAAAVTPSDSEEEEQQSASDLTDLVSDSDLSEEGHVQPVKGRKSGGERRALSPRVVITPKLSRIGSVKSHFFNGKRKRDDTDDDGQDCNDSEEDRDEKEEDDDEDEEEEEEEEEVIRPRRTTARTRNK